MRYVASCAAKLRAMNVPRRLALTASAVLMALSLLAVPASADTVIAAPAELAVEEAPATGDDDHRIPLADTPRDRFSLLMWGVLFAGGAAALINARRQLKGEREQATGEFRWR